MCGSIAPGTAAALTTPRDVLKTCVMLSLRVGPIVNLDGLSDTYSGSYWHTTSADLRVRRCKGSLRASYRERCGYQLEEPSSSVYEWAVRGLMSA